jgi:hypothetical protein
MEPRDRECRHMKCNTPLTSTVPGLLVMRNSAGSGRLPAVVAGVTGGMAKQHAATNLIAHQRSDVVGCLQQSISVVRLPGTGRRTPKPRGDEVSQESSRLAANTAILIRIYAL